MVPGLTLVPIAAAALFPGLIVVLQNGKIIEKSGADADLAEAVVSHDDTAIIDGKGFLIQKKTVGDSTYCYAWRV